jgi:hypothetical protein
MDREAGGMLKFPNVAVEDGIGLDLEDGHGGCWGLSEGGEGVGNRNWACRLLFPISRLSLSKKTTSAIYWSVFLNLGYLRNRIKHMDTASLLLNIDVRQSQTNLTVGQNRSFLATILSV